VVCGSVRLPGDNDMDNESVMQPLSKIWGWKRNVEKEKACLTRQTLKIRWPDRARGDANGERLSCGESPY
jgi:hypothetical protein